VTSYKYADDNNNGKNLTLSDPGATVLQNY